VFLILAGTGELRYGNTSHPLREGDVIACPTGGPETAHQIINTGTVEMRYLAVSNVADTEVCEYPDSGKFLVSTGTPSNRREVFEHIGRQDDAREDWQGE